MKRRLQMIYNINNEAYRYNSPWDLISDFKQRTLDAAAQEIDIPWRVDSVDFIKRNLVIVTVITDNDPRPFVPSDPIESDLLYTP